MKKTTKLSILCFLTLLCMIAVEVLMVLALYQTGMVPDNIMILGIIFLGMVTFFIALIMFLPGSRRSKKKVGLILRKSFAIILTVVVSVGCLIGTKMVVQLGDTIHKISAPKTETVTYAVYVMENDSAKKISDAQGYTFGISDSYEKEKLDGALQALQEQTAIVPNTVNYDDIFSAVDALYADEVDALIMGEGYVSVLDDLEGYQDFNNKTRILYTISMEIALPTDDTQGGENQTYTSSITEPFIMYLSGSDTREKTLEVSRSDTNILFVCNPKTREILMVNTPRDYYVENPAKGMAYDKLTHCGLYGLDNSMKALSNLYNVNVDHYMQINFTGFETLVDAIGGIEITVDEEVYMNEGQKMLDPGTTRIDGAHALVFARLRKTLPDGDNDRGKNQMKVVKAIINQMTATNVISNYTGILSSLSGMFDTSVSYDQISEFVKLILGDPSKPWNINSYAVTGIGGSNITASTGEQSLYVTYPDAYSIASASMLIDTVLQGGHLTEADCVPETAIEKAKNDPKYGNVEQKTFVDVAPTVPEEDYDQEESYDYNYDYDDEDYSDDDYEDDSGDDYEDYEDYEDYGGEEYSEYSLE